MWRCLGARLSGGSTLVKTMTIITEENQGFNEKLSSCIYSDTYRKELTKISAAVMGIEFAYAAETAFVSPTLLKIGEKKHNQC